MEETIDKMAIYIKIIPVLQGHSNNELHIYLYLILPFPTVILVTLRSVDKQFERLHLHESAFIFFKLAALVY